MTAWTLRGSRGVPGLSAEDRLASIKPAGEPGERDPEREAARRREERPGAGSGSPRIRPWIRRCCDSEGTSISGACGCDASTPAIAIGTVGTSSTMPSQDCASL